MCVRVSVCFCVCGRKRKREKTEKTNESSALSSSSLSLFLSLSMQNGRRAQYTKDSAAETAERKKKRRKATELRKWRRHNFCILLEGLVALPLQPHFLSLSLAVASPYTQLTHSLSTLSAIVSREHRQESRCTHRTPRAVSPSTSLAPTFFKTSATSTRAAALHAQRQQ